MNLQLIDNWWSIIKASLVTRLGWALGAYASFLSIEQTMFSADDQIAWHVAFQQHWFPIVTAVLAIFGISAARAVKQQSVTDAANKPPK